MARAREHLPAAEERCAERGLEEVRPERVDPDGSRMQASRRAVRAAAGRVDGACVSVRGNTGEDLDALKKKAIRAVDLPYSPNAGPTGKRGVSAPRGTRWVRSGASSKRAVGDQSALAREGTTSKLGRSIVRRCSPEERARVGLGGEAISKLGGSMCSAVASVLQRSKKAWPRRCCLAPQNSEWGG